jgi:hypothetical protein
MVNIKSALNWLKTSRYGLIVAYLICVLVSYGAIWAFIEPLDIPETIGDLGNLPQILTKRSTLHIGASFVLGAFLTLLLDLLFRAEVTRMYKNLTLQRQVPLAAQTLKEYDSAFDDLCKQLAFAIGRYQDHKRTPDEHNIKYAMDRVNEVRRARMRFLKVCGPLCRTFLRDEGTEWLNDLDSFVERAYEIETKLSELISEDREVVEKKAIDREQKTSP